ncbi:MAG: hypothetical protein Q3966_08365, partial [Neisseria sp.]|nr:hypothetical protein [Neisseria sp.]
MADIKAYWKAAALLPLLAFVAATIFGLIEGRTEPVGSNSDWLLFSLYLGILCAAFILPAAFLYAVAAKYLKLSRGIKGTLLSALPAGMAALAIAVLWIISGPARPSLPWEGLIAAIVLPALSAAAAGAAA